MAENSHISWTDNTHNEWIGCTKVSAGCDNCYAEREQDIRYGRAKWGKGNERYLTSESNRRRPYAWDKQAAKEGRRIKVFTASLSDVFDEEVPDAWRDRLFETIRATPNLDWLVLTKRLAKMLRYVGDMAAIPTNVWWGCSVEDQPTADQRVSELLKLRVLVGDAPLWLSVEPLIGGINLRTQLGRAFVIPTAWSGDGPERSGRRQIDWVVVGGESGPAARPMHPDWARSLRDQCVGAGVAFHFKQWGEWLPISQDDGALIADCATNPSISTCPTGQRSKWKIPTIQIDVPDKTNHADGFMMRVGKKTAGRLLDGREWNEFPVGLARNGDRDHSELA